MNEWFYARGGQQSGPVTWEQLAELARSGALDPVKDLVWTSTMKDWVPAGEVKGLFTAPAPESPAVSLAPPADPSNPYAAPQSVWTEPARSSIGALTEIIPGSESIDPTECVKRGFELTKRHFGNILLVGLVYFAIFMGISFVVGLVQGVVGAVSMRGSASGDSVNMIVLGANLVGQIVTQVVSVFLGLGLARIGLNLISGKEFSVGMLFGEGHKLLRAIGASILFGLMVMVGVLLLVVPGIYLALRYGQFMNAIVDRDLGVMDSFAYSSSITTNNKLQLFLLALLCFVVVLAGLIACGVGLIFAGPVAWLSWLAAYRWMQYGRRAFEDQPGTTTPLLAGQ
jgi:hypothetical protein